MWKVRGVSPPLVMALYALSVIESRGAGPTRPASVQ